MQRKALTVFALALVASAGWLLLQDRQVQRDNHFVVIGHIEHRDRTITVKAGPEGTVYTIAIKGGGTLYENLPADQLARRAPEIHDFIESATASYAGMGREFPLKFIDATK